MPHNTTRPLNPRRLPALPLALLLAALAALALGLGGCRTLDQSVDESLSAAEFFQRAQEASDARDYPLAMRYYETFLRVHPEDQERTLWAAYEIAFLYHKMGDDRKAVELFDDLLARYRSPESEGWPQGPRMLAQKVRDSLAPAAVRGRGRAGGRTGPGPRRAAAGQRLPPEEPPAEPAPDGAGSRRSRPPRIRPPPTARRAPEPRGRGRGAPPGPGQGARSTTAGKGTSASPWT